MRDDQKDNLWVSTKPQDKSWKEPDWDFIDHVNKLEKEWKKDLQNTLPKTDVEWLRIFPEAKSVISNKIDEWNIIAKQSRIQVKTALEIIKDKSAIENQWFWKEVLKYAFPPVKELAMANWHIRRLKWLLPKRNKKKTVLWNEDVQKAKEHDLISVIEYYGLKLQKSGKNYKALCPFHNERTPSFVVYPPSKFYCFGCHSKGNAITFVMLTDHCSFKESIIKLQNI